MSSELCVTEEYFKLLNLYFELDPVKFSKTMSYCIRFDSLVVNPELIKALVLFLRG